MIMNGKAEQTNMSPDCRQQFYPGDSIKVAYCELSIFGLYLSPTNDYVMASPIM